MNQEPDKELTDSPDPVEEPAGSTVTRKIPTTMPEPMSKEELAALEKELDEENERLGFTEDDDTDLDDLIRSGHQ